MDSCITSPREPVLITRPLPLTADDSMVSNSPPTWVQAKPVTCPTWFSLSARPKSNLRTPRYSSKELESIVSSSAFLDLDRKSTRLNSSHVAISYAVFCLKKKEELHSTVWARRQLRRHVPV